MSGMFTVTTCAPGRTSHWHGTGSLLVLLTDVVSQLGMNFLFISRRSPLCNSSRPDLGHISCHSSYILVMYWIAFSCYLLCILWTSMETNLRIFWSLPRIWHTLMICNAYIIVLLILMLNRNTNY